MEAQQVDIDVDWENKNCQDEKPSVGIEEFVPCFFCCTVTPFSPNVKVRNFGLKINALCKVMGIPESLFGSNLEKSPFCDDCVGIIKTVSFLNKSVESLLSKLNVQKNIIWNLLKKQYQLESLLEQRLYSAFLPSEVRKKIVERLGINTVIPDRECEKKEPIDFYDSITTSPEVCDNSDPDWTPSSTVNADSHQGERNRNKTNRGRAGTKIGTQRRPISPSNPIVCTHMDPVKGPCYRRFPNEEKLQIHLLRHSRRNDLYKCPHCPRFMSSNYSLDRHVMLHTGETKLVCEVCGESFRTEYLLKQHEIKAHRKDFPYHCEICSQGFIRPVEVKYHSYTHTGNWPLKCDICNFGAVNKSRLERHKLHNHIEAGAELLSCPTCQKQFANTLLLEKHSKRHVEVRAHHCSICLSTFKTLRDVRVHIHDVHTDKRLHLCQLCGADFKTIRHLKNHLAGHDKRKMPFRTRNRPHYRKIQHQTLQVPESSVPVESNFVATVEEPCTDNSVPTVQKVYEISFSPPDLNPSELLCFSNLPDPINPSSSVS
ncbi:unnamed protein product [Allacma fusca]|uniref:C2H2-type domain-containing protein n=1 Tax=Allacma fusca TaxID=39272 RepID=A0A8J2LAP8_9HEXA|nr:unnamed protein product [Allacma fusca]